MGSAGQTNTRFANATRGAHADESRTPTKGEGTDEAMRRVDAEERVRRRWRRARGGSGAGGEGTELNDGEEPIMLRSIDVAVRKRDVVLRNAGRGGGGWPQDVAGVVDLDSVEPEGDGDRSAGNEILVADKRARVAEAGRLNLALEFVNAFVVEGESTIGAGLMKLSAAENRRIEAIVAH